MANQAQGNTHEFKLTTSNASDEDKAKIREALKAALNNQLSDPELQQALHSSSHNSHW